MGGREGGREKERQPFATLTSEVSDSLASSSLFFFDIRLNEAERFRTIELDRARCMSLRSSDIDRDAPSTESAELNPESLLAS